MAASPRITASKPGRSTPPSQPTTAASKTATSTAKPRRPPAKTPMVATISTSVTTSHLTPLVWRWWGSGGGSPVGRRRSARAARVGMGPGGPGGPFGWRVHQALPQTSLARHQASQAEGPSALPRPVVKAPGRLSR